MAAYGTDEGFSDWLDEQGYRLPTGVFPAVLRARGSTYVDSYEVYWTGSRAGGAMQELGWPRVNAFMNCITAVPADAIPPAVITASYRAAWLEVETPGVLAGPVTTPGKRVKRQKVDSIEREFFDDGAAKVGSATAFIDPIIDSLLRQFICDRSAGAFIFSLGS
ncbi:DnaT-like ssDNA-binding protein [Novosphingobium sp. B1]|uniref:DnaT-like ssDNA-binding protein n=1 Tax=Novosphingobium sp. B1 TaxID=1938756 RepID=UPI0009D7CBAF|nr:DnaT-like ssDNA-binding protein [Novosphingobium sp. B1]SMC97130.1 hypothetical protein SAMN06272759_11511 [Novosphingobium sp. B1]